MVSLIGLMIIGTIVVIVIVAGFLLREKIKADAVLDKCKTKCTANGWKFNAMSCVGLDVMPYCECWCRAPDGQHHKIEVYK